MIQYKAQFAVNGYSLNKGWTKSRHPTGDAVLSYLWVSLRARREAVICCVAWERLLLERPLERLLVTLNVPLTTMQYTRDEYAR